jgi:plasmid stabilization system protein ParE
MKYRVVLQKLAIGDLEEAYRWAAKRAPLTATRWLDRFEAALKTLDTNADRCALARENGKASVELREYHYGKRPYVYRAVFTIDGATVRVLRIRRAQRRFLTRGEIEEALRPDQP